MTYPGNFEEKIEFPRIREMLLSECLCALGHRKVQEMHFLTDPASIRHALTVTEEFRNILLMERSFPSQDYWDASPLLERIRIPGTWPEVSEVVLLRNSVATIHEICAFFSRKDPGVYPLLQHEAGRVPSFPAISRAADALLDPTGQIRDNASPLLAQIRRSIAEQQQAVTRIMQRMLKQAQADGLAESGSALTLREGRLVIPVTAGLKRKLPGIVHDESATGKTAYIEPTSVVEINNQVRELRFAEQREIVRILTEFADLVRPFLPDLHSAYEFLGDVDFWRAKASLALKTRSVLPVLDTTGHMHWAHARHPLMEQALIREGRQVVPLDIAFDNQHRIILISGPNAGGKSACLKTVGLLQYMLQCGLLVPMSENSETRLFRNIFMDIGDEQSIEQDLSTYSSHLRHMNYFTRHAGPDTLVLIDEFGSGTEPQLGGALAEAILNYLNQNKVWGVITTHYGNLKHFASANPGILNGAMLYDTSLMQPLFRLELGRAGSSFAFEIARQTGLNEEILQDAANKVGHDQVDFEKHLREAERDKRYWERKREQIRKREKELEETLARYMLQAETLEKERSRTLRQAREEADRILEDANKLIERTIREIKESQAEKERTRKARAEMDIQRKQSAESQNRQEKDSQQALDQMKALGEKLLGKKSRSQSKSGTSGEYLLAKSPQTAQPHRPPQAGDWVILDDAGIPGEILSIESNQATVAFGQMKTVVPLKRLRKVSATEAKKRSQTPRPSAPAFDTLQRRANFKPGIDVRGERTQDALIKVEELLDEASMLDIGEIKILHGKGNGILRQMIRQYLSTSPVVASFRDESIEQGGTGITIVRMK